MRAVAALPSLLLRDHVGDEEPLPVVVQGERVVVVVHPAHLHAAQAELDVRLADLDLAQLEDAVREEVFPPLGEPLRAERRLRDHERREVELLERGEEVVHLPPRVLHLREGVERLEAVQGEDLVVARADRLLHDLQEDRHPVLRALRALHPTAQLAHVQDVHVGLVELLHPHPHGARPEAFHGLLEADVEGPRPVRAGVLVHHPED